MCDQNAKDETTYVTKEELQELAQVFYRQMLPILKFIERNYIHQPPAPARQTKRITAP